MREIAADKGFLFSDVGEFVPRDFDEAVRLYEVRWREEAVRRDLPEGTVATPFANVVSTELTTSAGPNGYDESMAQATDAITWHARSGPEAARALESDAERGLAAREAERRLERWGPNELPEAAGRGWLSALTEQFTQFLVMVLVAAAAVSLALGEYLDAGAILAIIVLNGLLGFFQEYRAERALQALRSMAAPTATVLRDGTPLRVRADVVVPGDVVQLADGDIVPADARLLESAGLRMNEAVLTGESVPVDKSIDALPAETDLAERRCMAYQGTLVVHGRGLGVVVTTGAQTEMGKIAASVGKQPIARTPLQRRLSDMGRWLVYGTGGLCGLVFAVGVARGLNVTDMFLTAASLAVAAIPEGLPAATTIVLALGVQRMARRHTVIRRLSAVETLGSVTVACVDKTGTLTQNRMEVQELWLASGPIDVRERQDGALEGPLRAAALCNDAVGGLGDPTEVALLELADRLGVAPVEARRAAPRELEVPFTAERARMTVVCRSNGERTAYTKGAPEVLVPLAAALLDGGRAAPLDEAGRERVLETAAEMARRGMRVLALAQRRLDGETSAEEIERELVLLGLAGLADPLRPEAAPAIQQALAAGIRPVMITGDHPVTARAIADALDLPTRRVVVGRDVEELPDEELEREVAEASVFARVSSQHKLRIVEAYRRLGEIVAMTGDGVNDAPALRSAHIGVAMGQGGTDVAREASDMVLTDNNFSAIVAAVEEGRTVYDNIRKFVHYLLACNLAEVFVVFLVLVAVGETALLPIQILFVNLLTDGLPALALGTEPPEMGIMRRRPRPPSAGILTAQSLVPLLGIGTLVTAPTIGAYAWGHASGGGELARDLAFATLVGTELAASFAFRSPTGSVLRLEQNAWLLGAVAASALSLVAVFYVPGLQPVFDTAAMSAGYWLGVIGLSLTPLVVVEAIKLSGLARRLEPGEPR